MSPKQEDKLLYTNHFLLYVPLLPFASFLYSFLIIFLLQCCCRKCERSSTIWFGIALNVGVFWGGHFLDISHQCAGDESLLSGYLSCICGAGRRAATVLRLGIHLPVLRKVWYLEIYIRLSFSKPGAIIVKMDLSSSSLPTRFNPLSCYLLCCVWSADYIIAIV